MFVCEWGQGEVKAPVQVWPGLGRTGHSEWGEGRGGDSGAWGIRFPWRLILPKSSDSSRATPGPRPCRGLRGPTS